MEFQYTEYTAKKKKELKHDGYLYRFSPYDLVWNNDCYSLFKQYNVFAFIEEFYDTLHLSSYGHALTSIEAMLTQKGVLLS